jgi:hypothetical protein
MTLFTVSLQLRTGQICSHGAIWPVSSSVRRVPAAFRALVGHFTDHHASVSYRTGVRKPLASLRVASRKTKYPLRR